MPHETFMRRCFELAGKARGFTAPNPVVGAILVHNEQIIAEGYHHRYGSDHAEVDCLNNVPEAGKHLIPDSTMYVNLEPCAHYGNTPPCATRLVHERVKHVVIANTDPFEKVNGSGIEILNNGGVTVTTGILKKEGLWLNRRFFCFHTQKKPYIILKWAQTNDGFIAPPDRSRFQITGPESQQMVHKWRTEEAAILVGSTTAINDNPQLTARLWPGNQPLRIILDRNLQIPGTHHLYDETAATWIINEKDERSEGNLHFIRIPFDGSLLQNILLRLHEGRILSLIVEGGSELLNSFISHGLWDEARIFTGSTALKDGIPSPILTNATHTMDSTAGHDQLSIFVNKNSPYQYVPGMEL